MNMSRWLLIILAMVLGCQRPEMMDRVVLYCSQDKEYAEEILADFTRRTGIQVDIKGDTEANKSVGLYESLVREARQPRCDVFWCNEPVLMQRLAQRGLLEPYQSPTAEPYPAWSKEANHMWQGFAARARVLIVHERVKDVDVPKSMEELAGAPWKKKWGMAKPFFGTTATHSACLWSALGGAIAQRLYRNMSENAVILPGNRDVAVAVAEGQIDLGLTDTDDAINMIEKKKPVRIVYPDQAGLGTLFLPNTLGLIKNAPHPATGRKLIDYLLCEEVESRLARGPSAQIPLNPRVKVESLKIKTPSSIKSMEVNYEEVARNWEMIQGLLRTIFRN